MADERAGRNNEMDENAETAKGNSGSSAAPFERSGSAGSYDPGGNWAAERERNGPSGGEAGMEGAPSGAGDGGYGPEGDFAGAGGRKAANILGQVNGDNSALIKEAQERGPRKADRRFTGGEGVDEPDANRN